MWGQRKAKFTESYPGITETVSPTTWRVDNPTTLQQCIGGISSARCAWKARYEKRQQHNNNNNNHSSSGKGDSSGPPGFFLNFYISFSHLSDRQTQRKLYLRFFFRPLLYFCYYLYIRSSSRFRLTYYIQHTFTHIYLTETCVARDVV